MPSCCGRTFTYNGIRNHLDNSDYHTNEIECRWCFARWPTHDGKLRLGHEQREHWLSCDDCSYIFESQEALQEHRDAEHPPNYCYGCKRRFQNPNNLNQHLKSSTHTGKNVKCPWCPNKFTNLTGVCLHLESGACASGINRQQIDRYCRDVDPGHVFTTKQIGWHQGDDSVSTNMATSAAWDGSYYRCYLCQNGFSSLPGLNQHLSSPAHRAKIYHCPRCRREFTALSGLVNHLESESCGAFRFDGSPGGLGFVKQLRIGQ
ncbi:MAG: hypothetical protein LQ346_003805 [Caloplaca aetnensis]|nr:MAG: hypothetical protein LQ346_003805 [Caloplaca aetnensis]